MKFPDKIGIFAASLILAIALTAQAFAGHGGFFASRNNVQAARLNAKAAQLNFKAQQLNAGHHGQQFNAPQRIVYVPAQQLRQSFSNDCHQNDGQLQFRQNLGGGCSSLYR